MQPKTINQLAVEISQREGGEVNLTIAQISEVLRVQADIIAEEVTEETTPAQTPTMILLSSYARTKFDVLDMEEKLANRRSLLNELKGTPGPPA